jgi:hypothetical protein
MKLSSISLSLVCALVVSAVTFVCPSQAESSLDCSRGELASGAPYEICMPPADSWNGSLLLYAHGYVNPDRPVGLPDGLPEEQVQLGGTDIRQEVLALGYAFAWTGYAKHGYAVKEGIADTFALYDLFVRRFNGLQKPRFTYITGASEGGLITIGLLEQDERGIFDGGLAACGAIGGGQAAVDYVADFRLVFDYFFNRDGAVLDFGPLEGIVKEPGDVRDLGTIWAEEYETRVRDAIQEDIAAGGSKTIQLLRVSRAPRDLSDAAETAQQVLHFNGVGTQDLSETAGGNPFENRSKWYRGSFNDRTLNRWLTLSGYRFAADEAARAYLEQFYEPTGELREGVTLVTLHNRWDPQTPYWHELDYKEATWRAGTRSQLVTVPVYRYGHCQFTREEVLRAFAALVFRTEGRVQDFPVGGRPRSRPVIGGVGEIAEEQHSGLANAD